MRQLTKKQKTYLDKILLKREVQYWDDLTPKEIEDLESINDTEILWMETNRYLTDKFFDAQYRSSA